MMDCLFVYRAKLNFLYYFINLTCQVASAANGHVNSFVPLG